MKQKFTHLLLFILVGVSLVACGQTSKKSVEQVSAEGSQSDFQIQFDKTLKEYQKLSKDGGAWRDTEEIMEKAKQAAESNDYEMAMKLLENANDETQLAMKQFESQKSARPHLF